VAPKLVRHRCPGGEQEGRFFNAYYDCYCYLPLYVFCGGNHLKRLIHGPQ
jgi:hypothetical protein